MFRRAVSQERFKRREEAPRRRVGAVLGRAILAELGAQLGLKVGGAGHLDPAAVQPLKFGEQAAPRQRRQSLHKLQYPIDLRHWDLLFRLCRDSAWGKATPRQYGEHGTKEHENSWRQIKNPQAVSWYSSFSP